MLEIRNRKTLQSKIKVCKSDIKIGDCAHSLITHKLKHLDTHRQFGLIVVIHTGEFHDLCVRHRLELLECELECEIDTSFTSISL